MRETASHPAPSTLAEVLLRPVVDHLAHQRRWLDHTFLPPRPEVEWTTPHRVTLRLRELELREFGETRRRRGRAAEPPLLVVAPEVNAATIADYGPKQSLVARLIELGLPRVALTCWRSADGSTRDLDVDHSIDAVARCIDHLGGRVHLVGICQGGWESAVVAARHPEKVATLTLGAAAIDFHAGSGPITRLSRHTPFKTYERMVALGGGAMRGDFLRQGFDLLQAWDRRVLEPMREWNHGHDPAHRERMRRLRAWYASEKDLPGRQYLRVVKELFQENRLVAGTFRVHGEAVDLGRITCPVGMVAGRRDPITLPAQVFAAERHVSSARTRRFEVDAGHVGVFIGHRALRETWPDVVAFLRESEAAEQAYAGRAGAGTPSEAPVPAEAEA